ncbi:YodC family protein [Inquilinus sp. YAF38]|uniref:YodC family protein n=1 Tax=Inquilinus sp. YAF38 TaxID=3233084 RepID=UPI003F8F137E
MPDQIVEGDVVVLKSGGPLMTVEHIGTSSGKPFANCAWFEGKKNHREAFGLSVLRKATPEDES